MTTPQTVDLGLLRDASVANATIRSLLRTSPVDLGSLSTAPDFTQGAERVITRWSLDSARVVEARGDGLFLVPVAGRVEVIPLSLREAAVLHGEGQPIYVSPGDLVGVRPSANTAAAEVIEISFDLKLATEHAGLMAELATVPALPDYYYGYSDRYAAVYAAGGATWEPAEPNEVVREVLEAFDMPPCAVIDLGCGEGRDSIFLASLGYKVVGVDVAAPALEKARQRAADLGLAVTFLERDVVTLRDLPRQDYDLALNMGCLHMIPDAPLRSAHLRRVFELLRPGGLFALAHCRERWLDGFFSVPDYDAVGPVVPGKVIPRRIRLEGGGTAMLPLPLVPYKEADESELTGELRHHGFEIVADFKTRSAAFGNTVVLVARRPL